MSRPFCQRCEEELGQEPIAEVVPSGSEDSIIIHQDCWIEGDQIA